MFSTAVMDDETKEQIPLVAESGETQLEGEKVALQKRLFIAECDFPSFSPLGRGRSP